jgi:hypothetical protein
MSPQTRDLANLPAKTLHVYGFLQCLTDYQHQANLILPAKGIMLLQAKNLGYMIPLLFRMIDMKDDFLTSRFDTSILGQRLQQWSTLTDSRAIHHLWIENPRLLSFLWFSTLREMLFIVHCWIKAQRFHSEQGFFAAMDAVQGSQRLLIVDTFLSHIPVKTLLSLMLLLDTIFSLLQGGMTLPIHRMMPPGNRNHCRISLSMWHRRLRQG